MRTSASKPAPRSSLDAGQEHSPSVHPKRVFGTRVPRNGVGDLVSWIYD